MPPPAKIPEEWACTPPPSRKAIDKAVRRAVAGLIAKARGKGK